MKPWEIMLKDLDAKISKSTHPKSRKAAQVKRSKLRAERLETRKSAYAKEKMYPSVDRVTWFQLMLEENQTKLELAEIHELVKMYLGRFDEELQRLNEECRRGRPIPKRIYELELIKQMEQAEYENNGLYIPDMKIEAHVRTLKKWSGSYHAISTVKMMRLKADKK